MQVTTKFDVLQRVTIKELNCKGRIVGMYIGPQCIEYKVRYNGPNEFKEVYFFEDELQ